MGLPPVLPACCRRRARPWVRTRIRSRSNFVGASKTWMISRPSGALVSIDSVRLTKATARPSRFRTTSITWCSARPSPLCRRTTTNPPACSRISSPASSHKRAGAAARTDRSRPVPPPHRRQARRQPRCSWVGRLRPMDARCGAQHRDVDEAVTAQRRTDELEASTGDRSRPLACTVSNRAIPPACGIVR